MTDRIEQIQVLFQQRNIRARGQTSSATQNDMIDEIVHDFAEFENQWNNRLVPLTNALPNGTIESAVDAFGNGLDGQNVYVDQDASASVNSAYYKSSSSRPNTIFEQFQDVYTTVDALQETLENQIGALSITADQIAIDDDGALYVATNVETALAEVMTQLDLITTPDSSIDRTFQTALTTTGTTITVDFSTGVNQVIDLQGASGDVTLTLTNLDEGYEHIIKVIQGSVARDLIWPAAVLWPAGSTPTITVTNNAIDVVRLVSDGSQHLATIDQNMS